MTQSAYYNAPEADAFRGVEGPRFYKLAHLEITRSIISIIPVTKFAWEVPVLNFVYGPDNVRLVREYWVEKAFIESAPTPESEYERMIAQYGRDDNGMPYAVMAYGQQFDIPRTLGAYMRECVTMQRPAEAPQQASAAPAPAVNIVQELLALKERAESLKDPLLLNQARALFQKAGLDWVEGAAPTPDPRAADEEQDLDIPDDPGDVQLPASIDPNGDGHIRREDAALALVALGVDPDPQATQAELVEQLDEVIKSELAERGQEPELEGEKVVARYSRARPLLIQ